MSGDVERLADDLAAADAAHFGCGGCSECEDRPTLHACTVLASDWLAERDQKMQATGAALNVLAHGSQHPDMETYARIHNEGWDAAMLAQVAPDPTTADDWLAAHDAEVAARALREAADDYADLHWTSRPGSVDWLRARADRVAADGQEDPL